MNRTIRILATVGAALVLTAGVAAAQPAGQAATAAPVTESVPAVQLAGAAAPTTPKPAELIYVPVQPCRVVDTRTSSAGKLLKGQTRGFRVRGTAGFPVQGGKSGGCAIPASAAAAALSITTVNSTGKGRINGYPNGTTEPKSTILSYTNANKVTANPTIKLSNFGVTPHLRLHNYDADTDLVIDVFGYYTEQIHARVTNTGALDSATSRVLSSSLIQTGVFQVNIDRTLAGCAVTADAWGGSAIFTSTAFTGSAVIVYLWQVGAGGATPVNAYFTVSVVC